MNILGYKKVLPFLLKHNVPIFVWGSQGVGKTQLHKQYCKENGLQCIVLNAATQEVGDLIGLPSKDEKTGKTYHLKPGWFPTEGKGVIFLDELNRAPNDVIQALFSLPTEGRLHTHQLPKGWNVIAAGNYNSDRFQVTDTSDAAWMSRFCHLDFKPTTEEFLMFAEDKGCQTVADFIRNQPGMLELSDKDGGTLDMSFIVPDRRSWLDFIGPLDNDLDFPEESRYETYAGLVGKAPAAAFMSDKNRQEKAVTLGQILKNYEGKTRRRVQGLAQNENERRFDVLNQPIDELMTKLEVNGHLLTADEALNNVRKYLLDIPKELAMKAFSRMAKLPNFQGKNALLNDPEYVKLFV